MAIIPMHNAKNKCGKSLGMVYCLGFTCMIFHDTWYTWVWKLGGFFWYVRYVRYFWVSNKKIYIYFTFTTSYHIYIFLKK